MQHSRKLLVVESDGALRATLINVLGGAGYKVSTDYRGGIEAVLAFEPDLVILGDGSAAVGLWRPTF